MSLPGTPCGVRVAVAASRGRPSDRNGTKSKNDRSNGCVQGLLTIKRHAFLSRLLETPVQSHKDFSSEIAFATAPPHSSQSFAS